MSKSRKKSKSLSLPLSLRTKRYQGHLLRKIDNVTWKKELKRTFTCSSKILLLPLCQFLEGAVRRCHLWICTMVDKGSRTHTTSQLLRHSMQWLRRCVLATWRSSRQDCLRLDSPSEGLASSNSYTRHQLLLRIWDCPKFGKASSNSSLDETEQMLECLSSLLKATTSLSKFQL